MWYNVRMESKNKLSKSEQQLIKAFTGNGVSGLPCIYSGINTSEGTSARWTFLLREGYVEKMAGCLGHRYNFKLTAKGREFLEAAVSPDR
jgi:hypothetical protein